MSRPFLPAEDAAWAPTGLLRTQAAPDGHFGMFELGPMGIYVRKWIRTPEGVRFEWQHAEDEGMRRIRDELAGRVAG